MRHRGRLLDTLHRAETGPIVEEKEFDRNIVAPTIKTIAEEHGISFPKDRLVNSDDELADRLFEAGLELARATVRRAERRVTTYARAGGLEGSIVPVYLNRLADLLYVLARSAAPTWQPTRPKEGT